MSKKNKRNPPYLGFNNQDEMQKEDLKIAFGGLKDLKYFDYISYWFIKAAEYLNENSKFAFVTTNSLCQGTQVPLLWSKIFNLGQEIFFTHKEFAWSNNAKHKAGVICSVVGVRRVNNEPKYIYDGHSKLKVENINAYLVNGGDIVVERRQQPLSCLPKISTGNIPYDGGNLILSSEEKNELISEYPKSEALIQELSGSSEFINGNKRYCLWIENDQIDLAQSIPPVAKRIESVRKSREKAGKIARNYAHIPHRFYMVNRAKKSQLIIPRVSSMRRVYIPIGFLDHRVIISDSAQAIYDPEPWVFSVVNSKTHMIWVGVTFL